MATTLIKWAKTKKEILYPPVPKAPQRILEAVGAQNINALVFYHHSLLRHSPIGNLYPKDDADFLLGVQRAADFVVEAFGGGDVFTSVHGRPALCSRHAPFIIDENAREIWLMLYKQTLIETNFPKPFLEEFWNWIEPFSLCMINKKTSTLLPKRFYFSTLKSEFGL